MTNTDPSPSNLTVTSTSHTFTTLPTITQTTSTMSNTPITLHGAPTTTTTTTTRVIASDTTITDPYFSPITFVAQPPPETTAATVWVQVGTEQETVTLTQTSFGYTFYYQDTAGSIYSTSTMSWLAAPTGVSRAEEEEDGFNSWPPGAKAGLIVGVVFAALIILWLLVCCYKRNSRWIAHDWRWAPHVEGSAPAMANSNMMPPTTVASPMTVVSTPSYQYGYPNYGYMRGGAGPKKWLGRLAERLSEWRAWRNRDDQADDDATPIRVLREMREATGKQRQGAA